MTPAEVGHRTLTPVHSVYYWMRKGLVCGARGYERCVFLPRDPSWEQVLAFIAQAYPHPSLRTIPQHVVEEAWGYQGRLDAAERFAPLPTPRCIQ